MHANVVKWRDALSIVPELGWDLIDPDLGIANWNVDKYNGYMEVTNPTAFRAIRPNNLLNADEGYFVFVADSPNIPLDFLLFTGVNGGTTQTVLEQLGLVMLLAVFLIHQLINLVDFGYKV